MLRAPVSAANSLLRSSDSAALTGNATACHLSPCKNPPRSPPTLHPALAGYSGGTRALRCAGIVWWGGEVLEEGKGGEISRYFYPLGRDVFLSHFHSSSRGSFFTRFRSFGRERSFFPVFTHLVEGSLSPSFFLTW